MNDLVLVTGGDGFLGTNIVRELLSRGYRVRILTEPGRDPVTLAGLPVETLHGDIRNPEQVVGAASGCDYLIHTAASTSNWPVRSRWLTEINVDGTRNVVEAALRTKVNRLVHVGSANSFGYGTKEAPGDENRPYNGGRYGLGTWIPNTKLIVWYSRRSPGKSSRRSWWLQRLCLGPMTPSQARGE